MRRIIRKIPHIVLGLILFGAVLLSWPQQAVWAGGINGPEASVLGVAGGTFSYKGKTYKAYSSYVSSLYSYLARDDVDLSSDQASNAISYIYSNVGTAIANGYVYEVGGEDDPDNQKPEGPEIETEPETTATTERTTGTENKLILVPDDERNAAEATATSRTDERRTEKRNDKEKETSTEIEDIFSKIEDDQNTKQQLDERVKPEEAEASATIREDSIVIDTGDGDTIELDSNQRIVPEGWTLTLVIVGIVTFSLAVVACLILIFKKCMRFGKSDRKKPMQGHRKRRKIRKICRRILTVTTAVSIAGIFLIMALFVIVFNNSRILQNVQDSGYFRYAYIEYLTELGKNEKDTTEVSEQVDMSYDDFVIREKQATEQLLQGNRDVKYQQSNVAPYVLRLKEDMQTSMLISGILFVLSTILGCVFTIFMDLRRDRGIRMIAVSEIIGTAFAGVLTILLLLLNPAKHLFIEPDYLYLFFKNHVDWMIRVLSVISVFGIVLGMTLVGLYFGRRKEKGN